MLIKFAKIIEEHGFKFIGPRSEHIEIMGNKILDSSGNSNIGILIGDYTLTKNDLGEEIRRQSALKTPKSDDKDGAI